MPGQVVAGPRNRATTSWPFQDASLSRQHGRSEAKIKRDTPTVRRVRVPLESSVFVRSLARHEPCRASAEVRGSPQSVRSDTPHTCVEE